MFKTIAPDQQSKINEFCDKSNDDIIDNYDNDDDFKVFYRKVKRIAKDLDPRMTIPQTPNTSESNINKKTLSQTAKLPPSPSLK